MLNEGLRYDDLIKKIAYDGDLLEYMGYASPGTDGTNTGWQIRKYTYDGSDNTDVLFASGSNEFDYTWSDRTGYSYS